MGLWWYFRIVSWHFVPLSDILGQFPNILDQFSDICEFCQLLTFLITKCWNLEYKKSFHSCIQTVFTWSSKNRGYDRKIVFAKRTWIFLFLILEYWINELLKSFLIVSNSLNPCYVSEMMSRVHNHMIQSRVMMQ